MSSILLLLPTWSTDSTCSSPYARMLLDITAAAATLLSAPICIGIAAIVLTSAACLIRAGAARPFRTVIPMLVFFACGLIAAHGSTFMLVGCDAKAYVAAANLVAGLVIGLCSCGIRTLSYAGLGLGAGATFVNVALTAPCGLSGACAQPLVTGDHLLLLSLCGGLLGAILMMCSMPLSVNARARLGRPNITISVDLPFAPADLYYELLHPHTPLGSSGEFKVDKFSFVTSDDGSKRPVALQGATRVARLPNGTTSSVLLLAKPPHVIVWKQVASKLDGVNMHGGGAGDEPGVKMELTPAGASVTRLTLEYYFSELSESFNLWAAPKFANVTSGELGSRMTEQMKLRGYAPRGDGAPSAAESPPKKAADASAGKPVPPEVKPAALPAPKAGGTKSMV